MIKKEEATIYIRTDAETKRKIQQLAKEDNRSVNNYLDNLLKEICDEKLKEIC